MDACMPIPVWPPFRPGITGERTRHLAMGRSDQRRREARRIAQSVETIARLVDIFDGCAHTTRTAPVDEKLRVLRGEEMSRAAAPSSSASHNQSTPDACFTFDCSNPSPEIRYPTVFAQNGSSDRGDRRGPVAALAAETERQRVAFTVGPSRSMHRPSTLARGATEEAVMTLEMHLRERTGMPRSRDRVLGGDSGGQD